MNPHSRVDGRIIIICHGHSYEVGELIYSDCGAFRVTRTEETELEVEKLLEQVPVKLDKEHTFTPSQAERWANNWNHKVKRRL